MKMKNSKMKKAITLLMASMLALGTVGSTAFAEETEAVTEAAVMDTSETVSETEMESDVSEEAILEPNAAPEDVTYSVTWAYNSSEGSLVTGTAEVPEGDPVLNYLPQVERDNFCYWRDFGAQTAINGTTTAYEGMDVAAVMHKAVEIPAVEPTETTEGQTAGTKCSVCEKVLSEPEVIPPTGVKTYSVTWAYNNSEGSLVTGTAEVPEGDPVLNYLPQVERDNFCYWRDFGAQTAINGTTTAYEGMDVAAVMHKAVEIPAVEPTETTEGHKGGTMCSVCETVLTEPEVIPATGVQTYTVTYVYLDAGQVMVTGKVEVPKDEAVLGYLPKIKVAGKCFRYWRDGETIVDDTTMAYEGMYVGAVQPPHAVVTDAAVAATCKATGLTEGSHCSVCGEVLTAQETVAMLAHTEEKIPAVEPTETTDGQTAGTKCSVCGEILKAPEKVPAKGHTLIYVSAVAATAEKDGNIAYYKCTGCGRLYADEAGKLEISADSVVVKATGETEEPDTEEPDTEEPDTEEPDTEKPDTNKNPNNNTTPDSGKTTASEAANTSSPNTGDDTIPFVWVLAMLVSAAGLVYAWRKKVSA